MFKFHLTIDGQIITEKPMTLDEIKAVFGSVQKLEKQGFRLIQVK